MDFTARKQAYRPYIGADGWNSHDCLSHALHALSIRNRSDAACHNGGFQCGSVLGQRRQVERYLYHGAEYARKGLSTVCETGVFKGESATIWLCSHPTIQLYAFDYAVDATVGKALPQLFPGRVFLFEGSSVHTIPQFRQDNPHVRCGISSVDGGHFGFVPLHDLYNFGTMSEPNRSLLLMDEIDYLNHRPWRTGVDDVGIPVLSGGTERACCPSSTIAWRYAKATGLVQERRCFRDGRGWCEGHFLRSANDALGWSSIGVPVET